MRVINFRIIIIYYIISIVLTLKRHLQISLASANQILCKLDDRRRSYDVILIVRDGGHNVANLLPVSGLAMHHI